jgi:hypothetical protein
MADCPIWSDLDAASRETCIYGAKREGTTTWPRRLRNLGADAPGKQRYVERMTQRYGGRIEAFNGVYGTDFEGFDALLQSVDWRPAVDPANAREHLDNAAFLNETVDRYYEIVVGAVHRCDPNHLVLGDKLNGNTDVSDALLEIVSKHCDLLFWQHYADRDDHRALLGRAARATGMPQMNGDASLSTPDPEMPNPLGPHYETQEDRAEAYTERMRSCFSRRDFLGWNWCGWMDRWERVQPMRQHSGIQDPFGRAYPIASAMKAFEEEMYAIALGADV